MTVYAFNRKTETLAYGVEQKFNNIVVSDILIKKEKNSQ